MKFAYLITVHDNVDQLNLLLDLLDDIDNDIYVHVDKKSDIEITQVNNNLKYSNIYVYKKYKVYWGDISQVSCQLFLLRKACDTHYDYYHLLSGSDLPLKSNSQIQIFFEKNAGKQLIHFESDEQCQKKPGNIYYYPFIHLINSSQSQIGKFLLSKANSVYEVVQKKKGVNRKLKCGANWFSITDDLAMDIIKNKRAIIRESRFSLNMDEVYLQTYICRHRKNIEVFDSERDERNYRQIMRYIDWDRGNPYTFHKDDFQDLISSEFLWARKFRQNEENDIIQMIYEYLKPLNIRTKI